jgi:dienelactone hydrolase
MDQFAIPPDYVSSSFEHETRLGIITRRVLRHEATGPTVILMHESPGVSESTFAVAAVLLKHDYRIVMPVLLDVPWTGPGFRHQVANMIKLCVAREISALSQGGTGAIVEWLRGLADAEFASTNGRPVGVIGMCFSGGFALGMITNPHVKAAVMSQPALPAVFSLRHSDLGLSKEDLEDIHDLVGKGGCIRAMRFTRDWKSPPARMKLIHKEFPDAECCEIKSEKRSLHSVLALAVDAPTGSELGRALRATIAFLDRHLKPAEMPNGAQLSSADAGARRDHD